MNYAALDVEELGSVYESLLDEYPVIVDPRLADVPGSPSSRAPIARPPARTTRRRELVKETLDSALDPVIAERLKAAAEPAPSRSCSRCQGAPGADRGAAGDPGLRPRVRLRPLSAGGRAADRPGAGPGPHGRGRAVARRRVRHATREAIIHCIYGVDKNPLAVDLCKVALWIEGQPRASR